MARPDRRDTNEPVIRQQQPVPPVAPPLEDPIFGGLNLPNPPTPGPGAPPPPDPGPGTIPPTNPVPGPDPSDMGAGTMPPDLIGDIPPPPVPLPPGVGVAGAPGLGGSTFARPGTAAAQPFRTPAYFSQRPQRFGPGVPTLGGGSIVPGLGGDQGGSLGLDPEEAAELLRAMAAGRG